jgi:hypothetical protein
MTHPQKEPQLGSNTSVNNDRILEEFLVQCIYGSCLQRLINWTVTDRRKFLSRRIMAGKIDFKSAFCRCHLAAKMAIQCRTWLPVKELILLYLRLTFGGCPCPNKWGALSESISNLANAILLDDSWDPSTLHLPTQNLVPPTETLDIKMPFELA